MNTGASERNCLQLKSWSLLAYRRWNTRITPPLKQVKNMPLWNRKYVSDENKQSSLPWGPIGCFISCKLGNFPLKYIEYSTSFNYVKLSRSWLLRALSEADARQLWRTYTLWGKLNFLSFFLSPNVRKAETSNGFTLAQDCPERLIVTQF